MALKQPSAAIAGALAAEGIGYILGLPGGHSVCIFYDQLAQQSLRAILARHGAAGAFAALGYAQ